MYKTVRVHTAHEIERTATLAREIWTEYYPPLIGAEQTEYMLNNFQSPQAITGAIQKEGYWYDLMTDGEYDIAYSGVLPGEESLFVSKIYVRAKYRKKGIARVLLRRAVDEHPKTKRIWLTVNKGNEAAIGSYQKMGFAIEDAVVTDIGGGYVMDDYIMARPVVYGIDF